MSSRHYCFTIFDVEAFEPKWDDNVRYVVCQLEETKEGKQHFQGYIELRTCMRWFAIKEKYLTEDAHMEPRMGTRDQARDYCRDPEKRVEGTEVYEWGEWIKGQGHRSDIANIAEDIKKNGLEEAIDNNPGGYIRFHGGMQKLHNHYKRRERRKVKVVKLGLGVSPPDTCYIMQRGSSLRERFAGYAGEKEIFYRPCEGIDILGEIYGGLPFWVGDRWAEWTTVYRY